MSEQLKKSKMAGLWAQHFDFLNEFSMWTSNFSPVSIIKYIFCKNWWNILLITVKTNTQILLKKLLLF